MFLFGSSSIELAYSPKSKFIECIIVIDGSRIPYLIKETFKISNSPSAVAAYSLFKSECKARDFILPFDTFNIPPGTTLP